MQKLGSRINIEKIKEKLKNESDATSYRSHTLISDYVISSVARQRQQAATIGECEEATYYLQANIAIKLEQAKDIPW